MIHYFKAALLKFQHNQLVRAICLFSLIGILLALGISYLCGAEILKLIINPSSIIWIHALIAFQPEPLTTTKKIQSLYDL